MNGYDEFGQKIIGLQRQQETARKLREQSLTPEEGRMVSGIYVAPSKLSGIAKALNLYNAYNQENEATKGIQSALDERKTQRQDWLSQMPKSQIQAEQLPSDIQGPPQSQVVQPKTEDYLNWATQGMNIDPQAAQMGMNFANLAENRNSRKDMIASQLSAKKEMQDANISAAAERQREKIEADARARQEKIDAEERMKRLAFALRQAQQPQSPVSIMGPDGKPMFVHPSMAYGKQPYNSASEAKDIALNAKEEAKKEGASIVDSNIAMLRDAYDNLNKNNGIVSSKNNTLSNLGAAVSSSGLGQIAGGAIGSKNQTERDKIAQSRPLLLQSIMKATGMSAKQMDSNAELKLWLATATDPTKSLEANRSALDNIERMYGSRAKDSVNQIGGGNVKFLGFE